LILLNLLWEKYISLAEAGTATIFVLFFHFYLSVLFWLLTEAIKMFGNPKLGVVVHTCNPSTQETEARGSPI
jgi:hypothetical protein